MPDLPFIFSYQRKWRIARHLSFWLSWLFLEIILYSASPSPILQHLTIAQRLALTWPESVIYLIPQLFLALALMYFVIPVWVLRGRYTLSVSATIFLFVVTAGLSALLSLTAIEYLRRTITFAGNRSLEKYLHPVWYLQVGPAMLAGFRGAITVGGLAAAIKLMKCFYEQNKAALVMQREKISAELQALKAQLHPHFLFNTLNNIYAQTQHTSPRASTMVMELSDLLRYILYECSQPLVPLRRELKMIEDYIELEKARYDVGLQLSVTLPKDTNDLRIAPLLLLPFIENAFKHGAGAMATEPWISLTIELNKKILSVKLINGKAQQSSTLLGGIGIGNVRKRLDLLYPDKHQLHIMDEEEMYVLNLKLDLT